MVVCHFGNLFRADTSEFLREATLYVKFVVMALPMEHDTQVERIERCDEGRKDTAALAAAPLGGNRQGFALGGLYGQPLGTPAPRAPSKPRPSGVPLLKAKFTSLKNSFHSFTLSLCHPTASYCSFFHRPRLF